MAASPDYSGGRPDEQQAVIMPNAESSPLWSLNDHSTEAPAPYAGAEETVAETVSPAIDAINPIAELPPVAVSLRDEPIATPEDAANEPPREARKGWWQRRFKA